MVTGGWKASNIFSFSPSFLFVFFCWKASIIIQLSTFFMSSFCFGERQAVSTFNFHFFIPSCFLFWWLANIIIQISPFFLFAPYSATLRRAPSPPRLSQFGWDLPLPSQSPSHLLLRVQNRKRLNRGERFQYKGEEWNIWDNSKINYDILSVNDSLETFHPKMQLEVSIDCFRASDVQRIYGEIKNSKYDTNLGLKRRYWQCMTFQIVLLQWTYYHHIR